jgi:hypothetical protein
MEVTDVYKLLFQGVFGVGHILTKNAWDRLLEESERIKLNDHPEEKLTESISKDSSMIRVNLRPYLRLGLKLEALFEAMKSSANVKGDESEFFELWSRFKDLVKKNVFDFDWKEIEEIDKFMEMEGVKPRHHSEKYREAYYPAYRVILKSTLPQLSNLE